MNKGRDETPDTALHENLTSNVDQTGEMATIHAIGERPMTIQEEEDSLLSQTLNNAFDEAEKIQRQHPNGREFVEILKGKATPGQQLHMECCDDCKSRIQHVTRTVKNSHLAVFLKERGYR